MYFKLELQPVNHGDYALPCCALSGSGGIPIPAPQLSTAPAGYCIRRDQERQDQPCCWPWAVDTFSELLQPSRACSPALEGSQPMSFPSWVASSVLAGAPSCPHTHANTPQATPEPKFQGAKHPRGIISTQNLCCVTVGTSAPWAGFAFRHDFQDYCF